MKTSLKPLAPGQSSLDGELSNDRQQGTEAGGDLFQLYLDSLVLVERLHRRLLDIIKDEFDRQGRSDINPVQALLIYNIGTHQPTPRELRTRGYYLGPNVTYNLKKLGESGFVDHERSWMDRRAVRIKLTEKGTDVHRIVEELYRKHAQAIEGQGSIAAQELAAVNKVLHRLERFWTDQLQYRL